MSSRRESMLSQSSDYQKTREELERLVVKITKLSTKESWLPTRYETFRKNCLDLLPDWEKAKETAEVFRNLKNSPGFDSLDPKFQTMIKMFAYLGLVESLGVKALDLALLILIANEKELHTRGPYSKHVETVKELEGIWDTDFKLQFLDNSNIPIFKNKIINTDKRNIIAHLKFRVEDGGEARDNGDNRIDIDLHISDFWSGIDAFENILRDTGFWEWLEKEKQVERELEEKRKGSQ